MKITWKSGSHYRVDAEVAHAEVEKLRVKNNGDITAVDLVEHARPKKNPLHDEFEWDDHKAASAHRCEQARAMLRSIVVLRDDIKTDKPQRRYEVVTVKAENKDQKTRKVYRSMEDVMADPDTRSELLARALRELMSFRNRFKALQELAIVHRSIDEVLETIEA